MVGILDPYVERWKRHGSRVDAMVQGSLRRRRLKRRESWQEMEHLPWPWEDPQPLRLVVRKFWMRRWIAWNPLPEMEGAK